MFCQDWKTLTFTTSQLGLNTFVILSELNDAHSMIAFQSKFDILSQEGNWANFRTYRKGNHVTFV